MITGKLYDWLKWIAQVFLPGLGTLYFSIDSLWGFGSGTEVVGTIMAVDLFLGLLLGVSQISYAKNIETAGELHVDSSGKMVFQIDGEKTDVESLADKKEIRFKVNKAKGEVAGGEH